MYPVINNDNSKRLIKYLKHASKKKNLILCGRLAEFKYYDMHQVIGRALKIFENLIVNL